MQPAPLSCPSAVTACRRKKTGRLHSARRSLPAAAATAFLRNQAEEIGLQFRTWEGVPGKTAVIMTLEGTDPSLASVILNSHIDVVPVFEVRVTAICQPSGRSFPPARRRPALTPPVAGLLVVPTLCCGKGRRKDLRPWLARHEVCWHAVPRGDSAAQGGWCHLQADFALHLCSG